VPTLDDVAALRATSAVRVLRTGDLHLRAGRWPIIGTVGIAPEQWPMPLFARKEPISGRVTVVQYADDDPLRWVSLPSSTDVTGLFAQDVLYGADSVEVEMSRLLS
jgi:hypothetical protein